MAYSHFIGKVIDSLLVAVPNRKDGEIDANPKVWALVKEHRREINDYPPDKPRIPYFPDPNTKLMDAGTARAIVATSTEHPDGTTQGDWAERHKHMTVV